MLKSNLMIRPRFEYDLDTIQEQSCSSADEEKFDINNIKTRKRASTKGYDSPTPKTQNSSQFFVKPALNDKASAGIKEETKKEIDTYTYFKNCHNKIKELKYKNQTVEHEINKKYRAKMIDWMMDVLNIFQQNEMTFYRSVDILDTFYTVTKVRQTKHDLHLNGMVSLFIASKIEQTKHIKLDDLISLIGKNKFSKEEILAKEYEITKTLNFKLKEHTLIDLLHCSIQALNIEEEEIKETINKIIGFVSKIFIFSSDTMKKNTMSEVSTNCLIISLKLSAKLHSFPYKTYVK